MSDPVIDDESGRGGGGSVTVSVSPNGQATIPKEFREKLGIDTPGKVTFRETEDGTIVVERVPTAEEMQGFAAQSGDPTTETPASELLREKRTAEKRERRSE
jgi:AbrB family looped-hinge helix DNA binding protein